jgi:aerobic-type carbon monoxide dehydrogenase small subunit (CoxS/CutS family)
MAREIEFTVNGVQRTVHIQGWEKLLDVLRLHLGLTGTKRGCDDGSCGACTVLLNDEAQRSCIYPASKLDGTDVVTIEGMSRGEELHPIQTALIQSGAIQCGYCIPGIVMNLHSLFAKNLDATEEEIIETLSKNLCRCTGYEAILEGARLAQRILKEKRNP